MPVTPEKLMEVFIDELARVQLRAEILEKIVNRHLTAEQHVAQPPSQLESEINRFIVANLHARKVRLSSRF